MTTFTKYNYCATSHSDWRKNSSSPKRCKLDLVTGQVVTLEEKCANYHKTGSCRDDAQLGMTIQDYNMMMALTANMIGFTLVFLVGFLFVLQGRR